MMEAHLISMLNTLCGNWIMVNRSAVHDYLGMDLNFSTKGVLKVSMIKYLTKILSGFTKKITSTAATPASENLFTIRPDDERKVLTKELTWAFHTTTAQLLFLSGRAKPDI